MENQIGVGRARRPVVRTVLVLGIVGLVAVTAWALQAALGGPRVGAMDVSGRDLRYPEFLKVAAPDRWGLAAADRIDYAYLNRGERHDQFLRVRLSRVAYEQALTMFETQRRSGASAHRSPAEAPVWSTTEPPSWWVAPGDPDKRRTTLFLDRGAAEQGADGYASGCLWEYEPRTSTLLIWDWAGPVG